MEHVRSVLVVDDTPMLRARIREILEGSRRYRVVAEAGTGEEALALYEEMRPDIVTLDIVMPGAGGIEACRRILALDPGAAIVVCSSAQEESVVLEAIGAGATDFLGKPVEAERLLRVLDALPAPDA